MPGPQVGPSRWANSWVRRPPLSSRRSMRGLPRAPDPMPGGGPSRVPAPPCSPVLRVPVLSGLRAREAALPRRALSESPRACGVLWDCPSSSAPARGPALIPARTPVGMLFRCSGPRRTGRVLAPFQVTLQVRAPRAVSARSRAPVTRRPARRWSPCSGSHAAQRSCRGPAVAPHRYHHPSHFRFSRSAAPSRRAQRGRVQNQAYQPPSATPARANSSGSSHTRGRRTARVLLSRCLWRSFHGTRCLRCRRAWPCLCGAGSCGLRCPSGTSTSPIP